MKKNPNDNYVLDENPYYIRNDTTGEKMLYIIDRKNNILIRSMLEDDIKEIVAFSSFKSIQKKQMRNELKEKLPQKGSEMSFFVIEEILPIDYFKDNFKSEEWDWVYGYPKKKIGFAMKKIGNAATKQQFTYIDSTIFHNCEDKNIPSIKNIINIIYNDIFGIKEDITAIMTKISN